MRRTNILSTLAIAAALVVGAVNPAAADKPASFDSNGKADSFVTEAGFDEWGYNYRAHMFSGDYCDAYQGAEWCQDYVGTDLVMKWNEAWLSSSDVDGDGELDRASDDGGTYIGSGAWLTNHMSGTDVLADGTVCHWTSFVKIVAAPADAELVDGTWIAADGSVIGEEVWGQFAIVQEVVNDPCNGDHGVSLLSPGHAGLGSA